MKKIMLFLMMLIVKVIDKEKYNELKEKEEVYNFLNKCKVEYIAYLHTLNREDYDSAIASLYSENVEFFEKLYARFQNQDVVKHKIRRYVVHYMFLKQNPKHQDYWKEVWNVLYANDNPYHEIDELLIEHLMTNFTKNC